MAAVKAGDVRAAKARFARARAPYETIEPVAESFGTWTRGSTRASTTSIRATRGRASTASSASCGSTATPRASAGVADRLLADCLTLRRRTRTLTYQPDELANGANGLLDEVASSKITGEEDRYSHTDLSDFEANVCGAQTTFGLLAPALAAQDAALSKTIAARFDAVRGELAALKSGGRYPSYATVGDAERERLSRLVAALAKPLARTAERAREMTSRLALVALLAVLVPAAPASAAGGDAGALLSAVPAQYRQAARVHDAALAARLRAETALLAEAAPSDAALSRLARVLDATRAPLRPWPTAHEVSRLVERTHDARPRTRASYDAVRAALGVVADRARSRPAAVAAALHAYALAGDLQDAFWAARPPGVLTALASHADAPAVAHAAERTADAVTAAQQARGDVEIGRATVVGDAAVLVFREGLEAVLILAAITASFVGARRRLRRPVLLGGVAGIAATGVTWLAAQLVVEQVGTGGLRLEAITGLLAIAVLLLVTNWFFHRVYWSQWIARFNRRRRAIERVDRLGFLSGQAAALALLGLTSVYREGFETVLFLQNLQVSAGTGACLLGAGIGFAATLAVGVVAFAAQRKLPYRRMLIATGVLIALVLAVMTGTTLHVLQGLGWLPSTPTGWAAPVWATRWLGLYATWEGVAAQFGALAVVLGSYAVAREVQVRAPRRRAATPPAPRPAPPPAGRPRPGARA